MFERSPLKIKKSKAKEFQKFILENAKDENFWAEIKRAASKQIELKENK